MTPQHLHQAGIFALRRPGTSLPLVLLLSRCSRCDPAVENCNSSGYRSSGGSYGGYSGGGGSHK